MKLLLSSVIFGLLGWIIIIISRFAFDLLLPRFSSILIKVEFSPKFLFGGVFREFQYFPLTKHFKVIKA